MSLSTHTVDLVRAQDSCLPLALPALAERFRVSDPALEARLARLGATIVDREPDVEIADPEHLVGDARHAVVVFDVDGARRDARGPTQRAMQRALHHAALRWRTKRACDHLRTLDYPSVRVILWDKRHAVRLVEPPHDGPRRSVAERLPTRAVVHGTRAPLEPTIFEAAAHRAGLPLPQLQRERLTTRWGMLVNAAADCIFRVAVGPARERIDAQVAALRALHGGLTSATVRALAPIHVTAGHVGLGLYAVESRLPGTPAGRNPSRQVIEDAVAFVAKLNRAPLRTTSAPALIDAATLVARHCSPTDSQVLLALALLAEQRLAEMPRVCAHGDFAPANLLVHEGRLSGVTEWHSMRTGQLPLLDLMHLQLHTNARGGGTTWGPSLLHTLLPWTLRGGDPADRAYCRQLGFSPSRNDLYAFLVAYWLNRLHDQLTSSQELGNRPLWLRRNVTEVLQALCRTQLTR